MAKTQGEIRAAFAYGMEHAEVEKLDLLVNHGARHPEYNIDLVQFHSRPLDTLERWAFDLGQREAAHLVLNPEPNRRKIQ